MVVRSQRLGWRAGLIAAAALLLPVFAGCAGTVDTLTSQRFRESPFRTLFHNDDPMHVLRNVPEGDDRARAMRAIKEPRKHGRPDAEHVELMQILAASATSDKQAVCRLSAIETLARFEDPQAAQILVMAYHNAGVEAPADKGSATDSDIIQAGRKTRTGFGPVSSFTPDQVITIQCAALEALGQKRSADGLTLLCEMAAAPARKEVKATEIDVLAQGKLGQDRFDLRQAAIRALAHYKGDRQAALTLHKIMTTEREVAPKNRAYQSLMQVTGKDLPPNSPQWAVVLQLDNNPPSTRSDVHTSTPLDSTRLHGIIGP